MHQRLYTWHTLGIGRRTALLGLLCGMILLTPGMTLAVPIVGARIIVATDGNVIVTYRGHTSIFNNDLYLDSPAGAFPGLIFNNLASPVGSMVDLGTFTAGTELVFRLHVNDTGDDFFTGDALRNPDGKPHARVDAAFSPTETLVEFEDLLSTPEFPEGFNDLSYSFTNVRATATGVCDIQLNQTSFRPGQTLSVGLRAQNGEPAFIADFYVAVLLPDGVTVLFVTSLSPLNGVVTRLDTDPRTFRPLLANVQLSQGLDVTITDFLVYTFAGGEPAGTYTVFAVLTPPGAFNDGRVDPGDLLEIDALPFSFSP